MKITSDRLQQIIREELDNLKLESLRQGRGHSQLTTYEAIDCDGVSHRAVWGPEDGIIKRPWEGAVWQEFISRGVPKEKIEDALEFHRDLVMDHPAVKKELSFFTSLGRTFRSHGWREEGKFFRTREFKKIVDKATEATFKKLKVAGCPPEEPKFTLGTS
jgi:hypothetical protein